jgi:hypothetical protein
MSRDLLVKFIVNKERKNGEEGKKGRRKNETTALTNEE